MNLKRILVFPLLISSYLAIAQKDSVKYEYILDDPYDIPSVSIYLNPTSFQMSGLNLINAGFSVGTKASIKDLITFEVDYSSALYFDWNYFNKAIQQDFVHPDVAGVSLNQDFKRASQFQANIGVVISDKVRTEKVNIPLRSATNGVIILTHVLPLDFSRRRTISARAGVCQFTTKFSPSNWSVDDNYWAADDGTKFYSSGDIGYPDVDYDDSYSFTKSTPTDPAGERLFSEWSSQLNVTAVTAGFNISSISNLIVNTDYGIRKHTGMSQFYVDFMYAPLMSTTDILFFESDTSLESNIGTTTKLYNVEGDGPNQIKLNPFGFRMGYYSQSIAKSQLKKYEDNESMRRLFNLGFKGEIGVLPGPGFRNFYFNMGLMWPIFSF
jgi:hypothetical protein